MKTNNNTEFCEAESKTNDIELESEIEDIETRPEKDNKKKEFDKEFKEEKKTLKSRKRKAKITKSAFDLYWDLTSSFTSSGEAKRLSFGKLRNMINDFVPAFGKITEDLIFELDKKKYQNKILGFQPNFHELVYEGAINIMIDLYKDKLKDHVIKRKIYNSLPKDTLWSIFNNYYQQVPEKPHHYQVKGLPWREGGIEYKNIIFENLHEIESIMNGLKEPKNKNISESNEIMIQETNLASLEDENLRLKPRFYEKVVIKKIKESKAEITEDRILRVMRGMNEMSKEYDKKYFEFIYEPADAPNYLKRKTEKELYSDELSDMWDISRIYLSPEKHKWSKISDDSSIIMIIIWAYYQFMQKRLKEFQEEQNLLYSENLINRQSLSLNNSEYKIQKKIKNYKKRREEHKISNGREKYGKWNASFGNKQ